MKRLIAVVVAAVLGVVLLSPPSFAGFDPPIPVDRQPNLDRPSGDDAPWDDLQSYRREPDSWLSLAFDWTGWVILFTTHIVNQSPNPESSSIEDEPLQEPSAIQNR